MTRQEPQWRHGSNHRVARLVWLAILAVPAVMDYASAQTAPYQYGQRATIGSGPGQAAIPKGSVFVPRVEATVQYAQNLGLVPDDEPQVDSAAIELAPGFYASHSSESVTAAIDYSLIGRLWDESDWDDVTQRLDANGAWRAVPEWFTVQAQATYGDTVIDPATSLNYGGVGLFRTGNLAELATASINPVLRRLFGDFEFIASYSYGRSWYLDAGDGDPVAPETEPEDSIDQDGTVSFGTARTGSRLFGRAFYDWMRSEYDTVLPFEYERAGVDGGLQVGRTIAIVGDVGVESQLDEDTTSGGLDSDFWSAGLRWVPSDLTSAEARFGHRFFGDSYYFSLSHRARLLLFEATYSEEPTVETQRSSLGGFDPGVLTSGAPDVHFGADNSSPYVAKDGDVSVTASGSRTRIEARAFHYERDFLTGSQANDKYLGFELTGTRQMASNLSADLSVAYSDYEQATASSTDLSKYYDTQATFRLNRNAGARVTLTGEAGYLVRSGDEDFDGWWVGLRARYEP